MAARLGKVLYWICCGAALLLGVAGVYAFSNAPADPEFFGGLFVFIAAIVYGVGRAIRYVLAGH